MITMTWYYPQRETLFTCSGYTVEWLRAAKQKALMSPLHCVDIETNWSPSLGGVVGSPEFLTLGIAPQHVWSGCLDIDYMICSGPLPLREDEIWPTRANPQQLTSETLASLDGCLVTRKNKSLNQLNQLNGIFYSAEIFWVSFIHLLKKV